MPLLHVLLQKSTIHLKEKKPFFSEDCLTGVGILVYFSSSCDQIPDKKKLKGSDVYFGSGVKGTEAILAGRHSENGRNRELLAH